MCDKHPTRLVIEETGFCFGCYEDQRNARFAALEADVLRLVSCGVPILETWPGGYATAWEWQTFGKPEETRIYAETIVGDGEGMHEAFVRGLPASYLAEHLVNRSRGFGTTLTAFCIDCGEDTVAIPCEDDPCCAKCSERRQDIEPPDAADLGEL